MNDVIVTIVGNVVDEPKRRYTRNNVGVTSFRMASTSRRYDREQGRYVDNTTLYVTVSAWRALGDNILASLHKGQPVVVQGRYLQRNYVVNEQPRVSYELEATSVGHDLARGISTFERSGRAAPPSVPIDADGLPGDALEHVHGLVDAGELSDPDSDLPDDVLTALDATDEAQQSPAVHGAPPQEYEPDPAARGLAVV